MFEATGLRSDLKRILVVDAEKASITSLLNALTSDGYEIAYTDSGADAIARAVSWHPALGILNVSLPDIDGREVIRILRKHSQMAIIALSSRNDEREKIETLDQGASDFVCKPIRPNELMARVRAMLRTRGWSQPAAVSHAGQLTIDAVARVVTLRGQPLRLTSIEFELLKILAAGNGRVVPQELLIEMVWGAVSARTIQYLRAYIQLLRKKIENDPAKPKLLVTKHGVGYSLVSEEYCMPRFSAKTARADFHLPLKRVIKPIPLHTR